MKMILAVLVLLLALPSLVGATTFYVCDSGADCYTGAAGNTDWETGVDTTAASQGQSRALPWKTINYAVSPEGAGVVSAGDTVIVGKGIYTTGMEFGISGSSGNGYIIVKSETQHEAKVDTNSNDNSILFPSEGGVSYISIEDFDLSDGSHVVQLNGNAPNANHHIKLIGNKIHDNRDRFFYSSCIAFGGGYIHNVTIEKNEFYGCGTGVYGYTEDCDDPGDCPDPCCKSLGYAIYMTGADHIVQNNIFRDPASHAGPFIKVDGHHSSVDGPDPEVTIINNVFSGYSALGNDRNDPQLWLIGGGAATKETYTHLVTIANNAFYDVATHMQAGCTDSAICMDGSSFGDNDLKMYSNRCDQELWGDEDNGVEIVTEVDTQDQDQGWTQNDFGFTNVGGDDYSLLATSNMIDKADATFAPDDDILGTSRPRGVGYDIGAYEFGVVSYQCSDGIDNDGDNLVDYPDDLGCQSETDDDETDYTETDPRIAELETMAMGYHDHPEWLSYITNDAVQMYYSWPGIDGLLSLYETTGNTTYVGYAVEYCQKYQSMGIYYDGDEYLDWYSSWIDGYNHYHVEARATAGCASTMALILTDPRLQEYEAEGLALKNFLETHVWEKWTGGYSNNSWDTDVIGRTCRFGVISLSLYKATGESKYLDFVINRGNELKNALRTNSNDAYFWGIKFDTTDIHDTAHSQDIINFMVEAHRAGYVFNDADIERLINTVKYNLWNGNLDAPLFWDCVDGIGTNCNSDSIGYGTIGRKQTGWTKLAQFDTELQDIYYNWTKTNDFYGSVYYPELGGWRSIPSQGKVGILGGLAQSLYLSQKTSDSCQSQGYQCCDSCQSEPHTEYNADCTGQVCCEVCAVSTTDPILHLEFEEGSGTTATDSSGNGNDGTINGAVYTTGRIGNYALQFDGNDRIDIGANLIDTSKTFTYSAWIKKSVDGEQLGVIGSGAGSNDRFWVNEVDNTLRFRTNTDATTGGTILVSDGWTHAVVTYDGSDIVLYNNGIESGRETKVATDDSGNTFVGYACGYYFNGTIDEVMIWNRSLSAQELQDLYDTYFHRCDTSPRDGCIEQQEIIAFINLWYLDSTTYTMSEMMEAVTMYYSPVAWCS